MNNLNQSSLKKRLKIYLVERVLKRREQIKHRRVYERTDYNATPWGMLARGNCSDLEHKDGKYFRRRFRVPYSLFTRLVSICRLYTWFPETYRSAPLELKMLATLRKLGRGGCFDNLYEACGIDQETLRVFYHKFLSEI